ncbi:eukaryotic membrane protein family-domain-containing protein [Phlyctochytrium arcticum]|nr:eukaryotic membrane protein family-domain-containing protein [Phlyctochytrium arcticum]
MKLSDLLSFDSEDGAPKSRSLSNPAFSLYSDSPPPSPSRRSTQPHFQRSLGSSSTSSIPSDTGSPVPRSPLHDVRKRRRVGISPLLPQTSDASLDPETERDVSVPFLSTARLRSLSINDFRTEALESAQAFPEDSSTRNSSLVSLESSNSHAPSQSDLSFNISVFDVSHGHLKGKGEMPRSAEVLGSSSLVYPQTPEQKRKPRSRFNTSGMLDSQDVVTWNAVQHGDAGANSPDFSSPIQPKVAKHSSATGYQPTHTKSSPFHVDSSAAMPVQPHDLNQRLGKVAASPGREDGERLWDYFRAELFGTDFDESTDVKKERIQNFLAVPYELEKLMFFGYLICFDSFLHIFTILPIRIVIATWTMFRALFIRKGHLKSAQKCDLMRGALIIICCYLLRHYDASQIYHSVRGQALIKLYVIFNVLEICDKLCSAFGHDILDSLFSKATVKYTLSTPHGGQRQFGRVKHFLVALCYVYTHSIVLFYQVMTLNVSVNSYNNALMTLLLSNQFVEIKGSVFKKFEKENLFQLSCADVVERFQLSVFLCIITLRNFVELTGGFSNLDSAISYFYSLSASMFAPSNILSATFSFPDIPSISAILSSPTYKLMETLATPLVVVFGTEVLVDWLKHAFISKFNHIKPAVYGRFRDSLCRDLTDMRSASSGSGSDVPQDREPKKRWIFSDQSPAVARRIGFVSIPLACLVIRVTIQTTEVLVNLRDSLEDPPLNPIIIPTIRDIGKLFLDAWNPRVLPDWTEWVTWRGLEALGNLCLDFGRACLDRKVRTAVWQLAGFWSPWMGAMLGLFFSMLILKLVVGFNMQRLARKRALELHIAAQAAAGPNVNTLFASHDELETGQEFATRPQSRHPSIVPTTQPFELLPSTSNIFGLGIPVADLALAGGPRHPAGQPRRPGTFNSNGANGSVRGGTQQMSSVPEGKKSPDMSDKLDRIDRYTMVKSRIV